MENATVDIDEAQRLARALPEPERIIRPRREWSTWVGAALGGIVLGFAIVPVVNLALAPAFIPDIVAGRGSDQRSFVAHAVTALVLAVARLAWGWLRQKPVEVVIDGDGITEKEGGEGRIHIRWREARAFSEERHYRNRYGQRFVGQDVRIAGPSGAMIVLTTADHTFFWPDRPRPTVVGHRIDALLEIARLLPPLDRKAVDPRIEEGRGGTSGRITTGIGTAMIVGTLFLAVSHFTSDPYAGRSGFPLPDALIMSGALLVGGALRAIAPLRRFLGRRRGGAVLAIRIATLLLLVAFPLLARKSLNQKCLAYAAWGQQDLCRR